MRQAGEGGRASVSWGPPWGSLGCSWVALGNHWAGCCDSPGILALKNPWILLELEDVCFFFPRNWWRMGADWCHVWVPSRVVNENWDFLSHSAWMPRPVSREWFSGAQLPPRWLVVTSRSHHLTSCSLDTSYGASKNVPEGIGMGQHLVPTTPRVSGSLSVLTLPFREAPPFSNCFQRLRFDA